MYAKIFMTARNRLRKRAAQKAKVPSSGGKNSKNAPVKNTSHVSSNTPSPSPALNSNPINEEKNASNNPKADSHQNSNNSTVVPVVSGNTNCNNQVTISSNPPASTPLSKNMNLASTAATIDPISNQVQTVVVSNTSNSRMQMHNKGQIKSITGKYTRFYILSITK